MWACVQGSLDIECAAVGDSDTSRDNDLALTGAPCDKCGECQDNQDGGGQ